MLLGLMIINSPHFLHTYDVIVTFGKCGNLPEPFTPLCEMDIIMPNRIVEFGKRGCFWASLVAQWIRICLPMQGTRVQSLVREDPTCRGAIKPVRHNY